MPPQCITIKNTYSPATSWVLFKNPKRESCRVLQALKNNAPVTLFTDILVEPLQDFCNFIPSRSCGTWCGHQSLIWYSLGINSSISPKVQLANKANIDLAASIAGRYVALGNLLCSIMPPWSSQVKFYQALLTVPGEEYHTRIAGVSSRSMWKTLS